MNFEDLELMLLQEEELGVREWRHLRRANPIDDLTERDFKDNLRFSTANAI